MGEKNKTYSKEFKIMVVTDYLSGRSGGVELKKVASIFLGYPAKNHAFRLLLGFGGRLPLPAKLSIE